MGVPQEDPAPAPPADAVGSAALSVGNVVMWGTCARAFAAIDEAATDRQRGRRDQDFGPESSMANHARLVKDGYHCQPPQALRGGEDAPNIWHFVSLSLLASFPSSLPLPRHPFARASTSNCIGTSAAKCEAFSAAI